MLKRMHEFCPRSIACIILAKSKHRAMRTFIFIPLSLIARTQIGQPRTMCKNMPYGYLVENIALEFRKNLDRLSSNEIIPRSHSFRRAAEVNIFEADDRLNSVLSVTGTMVCRSATPNACLYIIVSRCITIAMPPGPSASGNILLKQRV